MNKSMVCNSWVSDGTYIAFKNFMENIVPEYIQKGLKEEAKTIYLFFKNGVNGVMIGEHNLGKIDMVEFVLYLRRLKSFKGFNKTNLCTISEGFIAPFNLEELIYDYYEELQKEDYIIFDNEKHVCNRDELTNIAFEDFKKFILSNIISETIANGYQLDTIFDRDGSILLHRLYLPMEIIKEDLYIGKHNLGKINYLLFLNYLREMPSYMGARTLPDSFEVLFNFDQLMEDDFSRSR